MVTGAAVLERYTELVEEYDEGDEEAAEAVGCGWALQRASLQDLQRLARFEREVASCPGWTWEDEQGDDPHGRAHEVLAAIDPECRGRYDLAEDFWGGLLYDPRPDGALLEAFVRGALSVWREVADNL